MRDRGHDPLTLSRRERQILDIVFRLGRATASDVQAHMDDAPTYTTVRGLLRILETKGHLKHEEEDGRYVYSPRMTKRRAGRSVLTHVVRTFFDGSPSRAMAALLGNGEQLTAAELDRLAELVEKARKP
jgi:predicted transcriptional regulator